MAGISFVLAIAVLVAVFWFSLRNTERLARDADWRRHTYQVIAEVRALLTAVVDAQTGERGYLLTGDRRFLAPFESGSAEVPLRIANLRQLTADNPRQLRRLAALEPLARAELADLANAVAQRRRLGGAGSSSPASREDRRLMSEQRARIAELEAEETRLLAERDRAQRQSLQRADLSLVGGMAAGVALLSVAFLALQRESRHRRRAEEAALQMNGRLEVANRELDAFSYSVSHDLRAPLRAIDGFSQALLEDAGERLQPEDLRLLARVRAAAQRMVLLIDDLLRLSRISRLPKEPRSIDLSRLAQAIAGELRSREPARAAVVEIEPGMQGVGDERLLRILLDNLLGNAWKFTRNASPACIHFGVEHGGEPAVYFIRDNGAGFDMSYANRLFGPFERLHSAAEFEGTGIGLATAARVVAIHGGRIWAAAEVGQGATFRFTLDGAAPRAAQRGAGA